MDDLDYQRYLQPISLTQPCGDIDPYDYRLDELATLLTPRLDTSIHGSATREAVYLPIEWKTVEQKATALLETARHLRPAMALAECGMHRQGLNGLRAGLRFVADLCERYWEELLPRDQGEDQSKEYRIPLIEAWATPGFLIRIGDMAVTLSRVGTFSFNDADALRGKEGDPEKAEAAKALQAAVRDTPVEVLQERRQQVDDAMAAADRIVNCCAVLPGGVNLEPLTSRLKKMKKTLDGFLGEAAAEASPPPADSAPASFGGQATAPPAGPPATRKAALAALQGAIDYFKRHEPSSPIPFLVQRAITLADKDFVEAVEYLTNDKAAVSQVLMGYPPPESQG